MSETIGDSCFFVPSVPDIFEFKVLVQPEMKIKSSFTHPGARYINLASTLRLCLKN